MARKAKSIRYYAPVPGSRELSTSASNAEAKLKILENSAPGEELEIEYAGEKLHRGEPLPFTGELYDQVMQGLDALEQAVLGHLHRLSAGEGADWVRVGKKELERRTGLSSRRLLKALSGLTRKKLIRPLHRDTNGTMYKVYTVNKLSPIKRPEKPAARSAAETDKYPKIKAKIVPPREKTLESPINEETFPRDQKILTMRQIATEFFKQAGRKPSDVDMDGALAQITYLLEDGFTREEVMKTAIFLAKSLGKKADISKLPYYINQVIADQD